MFIAFGPAENMGPKGAVLSFFCEEEVMSRTFVVSAAVLFLSFSARAQSRSVVAGTWTISLTFGSGPDVHVCSGTMHLSGSDAALTGAAVCRTPSSGFYYSASVSGELDDRVIRLNLTGNTSISGGGQVLAAEVALLTRPLLRMVRVPREQEQGSVQLFAHSRTMTAIP